MVRHHSQIARDRLTRKKMGVFRNRSRMIPEPFRIALALALARAKIKSAPRHKVTRSRTARRFWNSHAQES